jgi:hypothetical protein
MANEDKKEEWLYYYALYHMIAHWSALMVSIGLLVTVWVASAYSGVSHRAVGVLVPTILIYLASLWFNYRMYVFSNFVHSKIEPKVKSLWSLPHPGANISAFIVTTILLVTNLW